METRDTSHVHTYSYDLFLLLFLWRFTVNNGAAASSRMVRTLRSGIRRRAKRIVQLVDNVAHELDG